MKKFSLFFILFVFLLSPGFSSAQANKNKRLAAYLQVKQFYAPETGNYVELHFQYVGYTVSFVAQGNDLIGEIAVMIDVQQEGKSVANDAYRLSSPLMIDSIVDDFYDIKRFALEPGTYQCNLELLDLNSKNPSVKTNFEFVVEEFSDALSISDVIIAESAMKSGEFTTFSKSGYDIIPRISTFYPTELNMLPVYFEVYNSNILEDSLFSIRMQLVNVDNITELSEYRVVTKHKTAAVVPIFKTVTITTLPTGKYSLNMTVLDGKENELSTQSYEFERVNDANTIVNYAELVLDPAFQNSITDDSVGYYLASIIPISGHVQAGSILKVLKTKDKERQRRMIQAIWKQIDPINTYEAWMKYKQQIYFVAENFKNNFQPGFETDRGRVYLQYGAPSRTIHREVSSSELPYEIWEYNKIGVYSNKKFIFYNPDLINNNYILLHSDMVGELRNPRWQYELNRRNSKHGSVDDPNEYVPDSWGNNSRQLFGE